MAGNREAATSGYQTVLVVDDDQDVVRVVETILRRRGYSPMAALGPLEALQKSRDFKGEIHMLLTDVQMPEMYGPALANQILAERPEIRVLLMSAHTNVSFRLPFLKKPFHVKEFLEAVETVMGGPPPIPGDVLADKESSEVNVLAISAAARPPSFGSEVRFLA